MTRSVAVLAYDLAVAVVSIGLFVATMVLLAAHEISGFDGVFLLIGSALGTLVAALRLQQDKEPWPIRLLAPAETPVQKTDRPLVPALARWWDWTGRAQGA